MGNMYIGNSSGKASEVKNAYIGVDGVARKIKQIYVGDSNGKARLAWSADKSYLVFAYSDHYDSSYSTNRHMFDVLHTDDYSYSVNNYGCSEVYVTETTKIRIASDDAKTIVCFRYKSGIQTYVICREVNGVYKDIMEINPNNFYSTLPNSGNTAIYHKAGYIKSFTLSNNDFAVSNDGKYLAMGVHGVYMETSSSYYSTYFADVLIFNISGTTPTYVNSIRLYYNSSSSSGNSAYIYSVYMNASNDLSVIATNLSYREGSTSYYRNTPYIGSPTSGYTSSYYPDMFIDSYTSYTIDPDYMGNVKVSPTGDYIAYLIAQPNPNNYVYYNKYWCIAQVDKVNKKVGSMSCFHSGYIYGNTLKEGWIDDKHFYFFHSTSAYANEGTFTIEIHKVENGSHTQLTKFVVPNMYPYNSDLQQNISVVAFDLKNNKMIYAPPESRTYNVCSLTGSNGSYTGFTIDKSYTLPWYYTNLSGIFLKP